jgi:DNA-binding winged helix-turn-helix (wHTH) protein/TolB-like protein/tetratricopeptide (TPR) repeat protein
VADRSAYRVVEGDRVLDLTPKLLDVLFHFLERPGTLVTKEELLDAVWPGANVTENALAQAISELREALGDTPGAPRFIRTISRRGYRFIAQVQRVADASPAAAPTESSAWSPRSSDRGTDRGSEDPRFHAVSGEPQLSTRGIAVLDFTNVTGDADVAWLAAGIAETVTNDLAALGPFRVIDRLRVVQTARRTDGSMHEIGAALSVPLIVTGSYQRNGPHLRITARIIDLSSGEAVADAKVDGLLQDVFALQDDIVSSFARELGVPASPRPRRAAGRETSSLEAYRAYTEGWLKLETLDTTLTPDAIRDFERAIALDPTYALAHTGLANAAFIAYEMTHVTRTPDSAALAAGIEHARRAIRLDDHLAEAHATLSFLLVSAGKIDDARAAATRAVALEPDNWRHQYRLAHATWGAARLKAGERTLALYPQFSYVHFEMTMVHVARSRLEVAEDMARQGIASQDRQARAGNRFPVIGFYWLLGAIEMARDRHDEAIADFDREVEQSTSRRLYGPEYAALALVGRGHAHVALGDPAAALESFRRADTIVPGYIAAQLGIAIASDALGDRATADAARQEADAGRLRLERAGRGADALIAGARHAAAAGQFDAAIRRLEQLNALPPPSYYGWTLPIDPLLRRLQGHDGFVGVLERLAERAR